MCPVLTSKPFGFAKSSVFAFHHLPYLTPNRLKTSLQRHLLFPKRPQPFSQLLQIQNCKLQDKEVSVSDVEGVTRVEFGVEASLDFGLSFKICGNCKALGNWNLESAPSLDWTKGDIWNLVLDLPIGELEAKLVVISSDGEFVDWEPGENRVLQIPEVSGAEIVHFDLKYLETENTERSINEREEEEELEPQTTIPDPETKDTIEETKHSKSEVITTEDPVPSTSPPINTTSKNEESMTSKDEQANTSEDEGLDQDDEVDVVAETEDISVSDEPPSVPEDEAKEEKDSEVNSRESSTKSVVTATAEKSTLKSTETSTESNKINPPEPPQAANVDKVTKSISKSKEQETNKQNKEDKQVTMKTKEASSELVWLSVLGLLSFPIVAWSEWSLYQTGCGLPPGPGGLLGALEGIGYLIITGVSLLALFQRVKGTSKRVSILTEASSGILVVFGLFVLISQVQNYGYIPSALPDQNCPAQPTEITIPMLFSK